MVGVKAIRLLSINLTDTLSNSESRAMSEEKKERPNVPDGKTEYVNTRQMKPNEKGFVGYETEWVNFQKEVKYEVPKKP